MTTMRLLILNRYCLTNKHIIDTSKLYYRFYSGNMETMWATDSTQRNLGRELQTMHLD